jgi:hypothetical protein
MASAGGVLPWPHNSEQTPGTGDSSIVSEGSSVYPSAFPGECERLYKQNIPGQLIDVPGDGNCLYYCMLAFLGQSEGTVGVFRQRLREFAESMDRAILQELSPSMDDIEFQEEASRIFNSCVDYDNDDLTTSDLHFGDVIDTLIFACMEEVVVILYVGQEEDSRRLTYVMDGRKNVQHATVYEGILPEKIPAAPSVLEIVRYATDEAKVNRSTREGDSCIYEEHYFSEETGPYHFVYVRRDPALAKGSADGSTGGVNNMDSSETEDDLYGDGTNTPPQISDSQGDDENEFVWSAPENRKLAAAEVRLQDDMEEDQEEKEKAGLDEEELVADKRKEEEKGVNTDDQRLAAKVVPLQEEIEADQEEKEKDGDDEDDEEELVTDKRKEEEEEAGEAEEEKDEEEDDDEYIPQGYDEKGVKINYTPDLKYFTTGTTFISDFYNKTLADGSADKITGLLTKGDYSPSTSIVALIMRWSQNFQTHYFLDIFNCCVILAEELGCKLVKTIQSRGWQIKWNNKGEHVIQYRKIAECIPLFADDVPEPDRKSKILTMQAIITSLYESLDHSNLLYQPRRVKKSSAGSRKKNPATNDKGHERIPLHEKASFSSRLVLSMQHLQIAFILVKQIFLEALPVLEEDKGCEDDRIVKWMGPIFRHCRRKREFVTLCHNLCLAFPNEHKNTPLAKKLLVDVDHIGDIVKTYSGNDRRLSDYRANVCRALMKGGTNFSRTVKKHETQKFTGTLWIVRARILTFFDDFDADKKLARRKREWTQVITAPTAPLLLSVGAATMEEVATVGHVSKRSRSLSLATHDSTDTSLTDDVERGSKRLKTLSSSQESVRKHTVTKPLEESGSDSDSDSDSGSGSEEEEEDVNASATKPSAESDDSEDEVGNPPATKPSEDSGSESEDEVVNANVPQRQGTGGGVDVPTAAVPTPDELAGRPRSYRSYYGRLQYRFGKACTSVSQDELLAYMPCVVVKGKSYDTHMHMSPQEFYFISSLGDLEHGLQYEDPGMSVGDHTIPRLEIGPRVSMISDSFTVLRQDEQLYSKNFGSLVLRLPQVIRFVIEYGVGDQSRDGEQACSFEFGTRLDFGNAGQSGHPDSSGRHKPDQLVGFGILENLTGTGSTNFSEMIGRICDSMQSAMDDIHTHLGLPLSFDDHNRNQEYAAHIRQALGASKTRMEWITIQVKCISRKDTTSFHKDKFNCSWHGYEKTAALCATVKDCLGDIWSVKFIGNSRAKVGCYLDDFLGMNRVLHHIRAHVGNVNQEYAEQMKRYKGSYSSDHRVTFSNFSSFWLDDKCAYTMVNIGKGVCLDMLILPTVAVRDYWLSAVVTQIRLWKATLEEDGAGAVEAKEITDLTFDLIIAAMYQNSPSRFYHIVSLMVAKRGFGVNFRSTTDGAGISATYAYYMAAQEAFESFVGGPYPRFNPTGIHIEEVFFDGEGMRQGNACFVGFRKTLLALIDWFNEIPEASFTQELMREKVKEAVKAIQDLGRCEVGEFRILILLQICALSGTLLKASPKLLNFIYPVEGKGAYNHLATEHVSLEIFDEVSDRVVKEFDLGKYGLNALEAVLCETMPNKSNNIDGFIKGQNLYMLQEGGVPKTKPYGTVAWTDL